MKVMDEAGSRLLRLYFPHLRFGVLHTFVGSARSVTHDSLQLSATVNAKSIRSTQHIAKASFLGASTLLP